jgi:hypothetical protein
VDRSTASKRANDQLANLARRDAPIGAEGADTTDRKPSQFDAKTCTSMLQGKRWPHPVLIATIAPGHSYASILVHVFFVVLYFVFSDWVFFVFCPSFNFLIKKIKPINLLFI